MTKLKAECCLIIILFLTIIGKAQNRIPFQLLVKLIVVAATVDSQEGNFILDTGVPICYSISDIFPENPSRRFIMELMGRLLVISGIENFL